MTAVRNKNGKMEVRQFSNSETQQRLAWLAGHDVYEQLNIFDQEEDNGTRSRSSAQ